MKTRTIYICEVCGNESEDRNEIAVCEAQHFGLTPDEKREWRRLCKKAL